MRQVEGPASNGSRPRFSSVLGIRDSEASLPALAESIEGLRLDPGLLEVIAVDAGSSDGSLAFLRQWSERSHWSVRALERSEADRRSVRSHGLDAATGEFVLFLDQDELLAPDALAAAGRLLERHPDVAVAALHEERSVAPRPGSADAPSEHGGAPGRILDLREEPAALAQPEVVLFRRAALSAAGVGLGPRVGEEFEIRDLAARLLLALPAPLLGVVGGAGYRRRARRGDAFVSASLRRQDRFADVLTHGHLELLQLARGAGGGAPAWIQHLLIDELTTWVGTGGSPGRPTRVDADDLPEVRARVGEVVAQLDGDLVREHPYRVADRAWVDALAHGFSAASWHAPSALHTKTDRGSRLMRITYRYAGDRPMEAISTAGELVEPVHAKTMAHRYLGMTLVHERILWVPLSQSLELRLDGRAIPIVAEGRERGRERVAPVPAKRKVKRVRRYRKRLERRVVHLLARWWPYSKRFRDAWAVMDRVNDADDNGQRLFEHLRENRPDINAWFVVRGGSDAWRRMRAAGVRRLVAHGSLRWKLLMINAAWLISSHARRSIIDPRALRGILNVSSWRYAFLQHGVIQSDVSHWLNPADIDLFVVSTPAELQSIVADGTAYRYSTREMRLTGLPRFDRLLARHQSTRAQDRNLVLVAPTWRMWLTLPLDRETYRHAVDASFWDSQYLREWTGLLASTEIAEAVERRGWRLGFMPHPDMQPVLRQLELPPHVEPIPFAGTDVQGIYAQCALLVTDYSSVSFDLAYIERPVVYYQFDSDRVFSGAHIGRVGYFDYRRDGFGPVAESAEDAIAAIVASIKHGPWPTPEYLERSERTFPQRDGDASARVVEALESFDLTPGAPRLPGSNARARALS